jgi:hypothetical protein
MSIQVFAPRKVLLTPKGSLKFDVPRSVRIDNIRLEFKGPGILNGAVKVELFGEHGEKFIIERIDFKLDDFQPVTTHPEQLGADRWLVTHFVVRSLQSIDFPISIGLVDLTLP